MTRTKTPGPRRKSAKSVSDEDVGEGVSGLNMTDIERHVGYLLRRAQLFVFDDFIKAFQPLNLRPATYSALVIIGANPGRSQREIASSLGIQRPNFVAMMDEFEARGIAERRPSLTDGRSHAVTLTDKGHALLAEANEVIREHESRMAAKFTPEGMKQIIAILQGK